MRSRPGPGGGDSASCLPPSAPARCRPGPCRARQSPVRRVPGAAAGTRAGRFSAPRIRGRHGDGILRRSRAATAASAWCAGVAGVPAATPGRGRGAPRVPGTGPATDGKEAVGGGRGHRRRGRGCRGAVPDAPARDARRAPVRGPDRSAARAAAPAAADLVLLGDGPRPLRRRGDGLLGVAAGARPGRGGGPAAHRAGPLQDDPFGRLRGAGGPGPEGPAGTAASGGHRRHGDRAAGRDGPGDGRGRGRPGGGTARPLGLRLPPAPASAARPLPAPPALPRLVRPDRTAGLRPGGGRPHGLPHPAAGARPVLRVRPADRTAHRAGRVHRVRGGAAALRGVRAGAGGLHAARPAHRCRPGPVDGAGGDPDDRRGVRPAGPGSGLRLPGRGARAGRPGRRRATRSPPCSGSPTRSRGPYGRAAGRCRRVRTRRGRG